MILKLCRIIQLHIPGFWSRHVGEISEPPVAVPIHPAEHYHLHTKPVPDLPPDTPVVRDPDNYIYFRENEGRFLAGGFEPKASENFVDWPTFDLKGGLVSGCKVSSMN